MVSFLAFPIFAERKTRIDKSGNATVKIIWNSNNRSGSDDTNWAEGYDSSWEKILCYSYLLDPNENWSRAEVTMYTAKDGTISIVDYLKKRRFMGKRCRI